MFDLYEDFQKLYKLYDTKLELSGVLVITIILAVGVLAIWIDDRQTNHFIADGVRVVIFGSVLAHMFGLYVYSKKKTSHNPEVEDAICPECKIAMSLKVSRSWQCSKCGGSFPN